jgi:hypothetical protein
LGDVGELIRRVGVAAEFKVVPEFPLGKQRRIDWVWMHAETDALLAGFEIEGANVPRRSVRNDIRRFIKARCRRNYIVTYGRRFNREKKDLVDLGDWNDRVQQLIDRQANTVKITLLRHSEPDMPEAVMSIARRMLSRPKQAKSSRR